MADKTRRARLKDLRVDEVAFVDRGANPDAHVLFWKRAVSKAPMKTEDGDQYPAAAFAYVPDPEKPSTWKLRLWETPSRKVTARQVGMAVAALGPGGFRGNRVQIPAADLAGVKRKVRSAWLKANPDRSSDEVPAVLKADPVPQAKRGPAQAVAAWVSGLIEKIKGGGETPPSPEDVRQRVEQLLSAEPGSEGGDVVDKKDAIKKLAELPEAQRKALAELSEGQRATLAALVEKAGKADTAEEQLSKVMEWLEKAKADADNDGRTDDQKAILKALPDEVRKVVEPLLKTEREKREKVEGEVASLKKAARRRELTDIAKGYKSFAVAEGELVDLLEKADGAGVLEDLKKVLGPASEAASKIFEILGSEAEGLTDAEAKLDKLAKELQAKAPDNFPTYEQAYAEISKRHPELYEEALEGSQ